jgi:hypothetical protein
MAESLVRLATANVDHDVKFHRNPLTRNGNESCEELQTDRVSSSRLVFREGGAAARFEYLPEHRLFSLMLLAVYLRTSTQLPQSILG